MNICVAGFYGSRILYDLLKETENDVFVVSHKKGIDYRGLAYIEVPNIGLEFGCYDYYLKNYWSGNTDVLFMHDDILVEYVNSIELISQLKGRVDCAYIFRDEAESQANGGKHGRMIYCSQRFLKFVKEFQCSCMWMTEKEDVHHNPGTILPSLGEYHTGFWFDFNNDGHISGKPPVGIRHYNDAIYHFHWFLGRVRDQRCGDPKGWPMPAEKMNVVNRVCIEGVIAGRRNNWQHIARETSRYGTEINSNNSSPG